MRLALLPLLPHFSDDVYRYLWDGWVQVQGTNPYLFAPADSALATLRTGWHALINHPSVSTIYPPAAQIAFAGLAALSPSLLLFKSAWVAADLGVGWLLGRLDAGPAARHAGTAGTAGPDPDRGRAAAEGDPPTSALPSLPVLLWLWSPLVIVEVAWSGHMEPLGILLMLGAVWAAERARAGGPRSRAAAAAGTRGRTLGLTAGALLGLGAGVKLVPLAGLPSLWRRHGPAAAAAAVGVFALLAIPYIGAGERMLTGLLTYAERWEFNAGLYRTLILAGATPPVAKAIGAAVVAGIAAVAAWRAWPLRRALLWTIGAALLLSPTVHPWYALWVLPFAALMAGRGLDGARISVANLAWLWFTAAVVLSYWGLDTFHRTGSWPLPGWIPVLVHGPTLLLLLAQARTRPKTIS